jgi:S-DNA-T family DNA segregation ATPase FtsK/SpoIIIE
MEKSKTDLAEDLKKVFLPFKILAIDPTKEVLIGLREKSLPLVELLAAGIFLSQFHYWNGFTWLLFRLGIHLVWHLPLMSGIFGAWLVASGFHCWGIRQGALRAKLKLKLTESFIKAGIETRLKETPHFVYDVPVGSNSRKLRVRSSGIPTQEFKENRTHLEADLNINISKVENPKDNRELVDIIYSLEKMPTFWLLDNLMSYKDFSFPLGKTVEGEVKSNLNKIPHYLIAGETNSGKSTLIRSIVMVLTLNNRDLETYLIDLKGQMDGQVFGDFERVKVLSERFDIDKETNDIETLLDARMQEAKNLQAKNITEYNAKQKSRDKKWNRILVVVDEIAELMPSVHSPDKALLAKIQSRLNRFSRIGRSVGIHLIIGVQKPDHKNLDATIKANLPGVVCFPVSHFSQSVLVLGNGHAAELNAAIPGRAIWKYGSNETEIQAPFLSNEEIQRAQEKMTNYFKNEDLTKIEGAHVKEETPATQGAFKGGG